MKVANAFYKVASLLFQAPVLVIVLIVALAQFRVLQSKDFPWIIVTLLHLSLLPLLYGAFVYKTKRISNADITDRKERVIPFFVITFIYGVYLLVTILFDAPAIFHTLAIHSFILSLILSIVTIFWKVSIHTAGVTQLVALLFILVDRRAFFLFFLIIFMGWMRIKMKSHDIWQVFGGILAALVSAFVAAKIDLL